jgi:transcriptional regulator with GAF, ATPase, and Fis domain
MRRTWPRGRLLARSGVMSWDLQGLLERVVDAEDTPQALERACGIVRDRLHATGAWVHAASAHVLSRAGTASVRRVDAVVARALATGRSVRTPLDGDEVRDGLDAAPGAAAAVPLRCGGETVGALSCAWDAEPAADRRHTELLLLAAATAVAPHALRLADARAADASRSSAMDTLGLLGASDAIRALRARVLRVAAAPFHVLVDGESGSGKELVARALHAAGPRRQRRLSTVNCAALTDELLEAELFGHARGAFTGAVRDRAGLFEEADGGTLFLDEVGELSLRAQAKLLRVLQDGEVRRVGESHARRVDVRLVAATNRVLAQEVEAGRFRADLRYRLEVVRIAVVPLRERPDDVAVLARAFWTDAAARTGTQAALHPATLAALARYHWPGNVRELQNVMRALAVNAPSRGLVTPASLPASLTAAAPAAATLSLARRGFEEQFVRAALARAGHRSTLAARELGVSRQGLRKLLVRLGIEAGGGSACSRRPRTGARCSTPAGPISSMHRT